MMTLRARFRLATCLVVLAAVATTLACRSETGPAEPTVDARPEQAAAAAASLGARLKQRLVSTMQADGPVAAVEVCAVDAPGIANAVSTEVGLDVGRTSLRVRNSRNAPDDRERAVLERWAAAVAAGTPVSELDVHVEAGDRFLWMKPIGVEGPCLVCHGSELAPPVAAAIAARYPADRATGYAIGDLRGAFTVRSVDAGQ